MLQIFPTIKDSCGKAAYQGAATRFCSGECLEKLSADKDKGSVRMPQKLSRKFSRVITRPSRGHKHATSRPRPGKANSRNAPAKSKLLQACQEMCARASGNGTLQGLNSLGPITQFSDIILAKGPRTPQNILAAEQIIHLVELAVAANAVSAFLHHSRGHGFTPCILCGTSQAALSLFAWSGIRVNQSGYYYLDAQGKSS